MSQEYQKYTDITQDMNLQWEAKFGKKRISDLSIETSDGETVNFVIRKPDRQVLEAMGKHAAVKNVSATNKVLISNCVLGGDMEALEKDGEVYIEVLAQLNMLKQQAKATVKKR
ncbi:hypothetical protein BN863_28580 [Formosa agariphila KMM 3901]|uniref:Uncharacterized protein n=1 Tax=Formosa agariphila (strain DSM 15362 / KCTC 12365 / LMG 23005 / KMM 3901 / M-2Alg 35-1) TaxID=1347342 RepID=T2KP87_FORAG|nr:hypothetical protein [Formosa agariphila]CDF80570.1 hypothetical protein BN863_28580 [Formosa agariphila KMM 3901]